MILVNFVPQIGGTVRQTHSRQEDKILGVKTSGGCYGSQHGSLS